MSGTEPARFLRIRIAEEVAPRVEPWPFCGAKPPSSFWSDSTKSAVWATCSGVWARRDEPTRVRQRLRLAKKAIGLLMARLLMGCVGRGRMGADPASLPG